MLDQVILDDPTVIEARNQFNSISERLKRMRGFRLSFDELLERFVERRKFREIAEEAGVTRQVIHRLYGKYFADLFGQEIGDYTYSRPRTELNREIRRETRANEFVERNVVLSHVKTQAERRGFDFSLEPMVRRGIRSRRVMINKNTCLVQTCSKPVTPNPKCKVPYWRFRVSQNTLSLADFVVFCVEETESRIKSVFIVPKYVLHDAYFSGNGKNVGVVYVYVRSKSKSLYPRCKKRVNFWAYKDAWHLLEKPAPAS